MGNATGCWRNTAIDCRYCGRELKAVTFVANGVERVLSVEPCGCTGERDALDAVEIVTRRQAVDGIPRRYESAASQAARVVDAVRSGRNVYLHGNAGTGKTHEACSALLRLADEGMRTAYRNSADLVALCRADCRGGNDEIERLACKAVLVLDDMGTENATDYALENIYRLVEKRVNAMLPTIAVSNHSPRELARRYMEKSTPDMGDRIISRLCGGAEIIEMNGEDRRWRR